MKKNTKTTQLGDFEVVSGKVRVTDPCYDTDTWCSGEIKKVRKGKWTAKVIKSDEGDWGNRCAVLVAHIANGTAYEDDTNWQEVDIDVGVDSGQAGIFDSKFYKKDSSVKDCKRINKEGSICDDEPFYSICCDRTLSDIGAGTIPYGCVSSSGFGDGSYTASVIRDTYTPKGEVIAIKIVFIGDEEDNDE